MIDARIAKEWLSHHPRKCMMCETEPATDLLEVWQTDTQFRHRNLVVGPDDCTPVCQQCLKALLGPVPNWPFGREPTQ
jgi:hypothetical protein